MTNDEAKSAFLKGSPVTFGGVRYKGITALIYRRDGVKGIRVQLELLDYNARCVVIVEPERVELAKEVPENG